MEWWVKIQYFCTTSLQKPKIGKQKVICKTYQVFIFQAAQKVTIPRQLSEYCSHCSEVWALRGIIKAGEKQHDGMVDVCNVTLKDRKSADKLRDSLGLVSIRNCVEKGRLKWYACPERMDNEIWGKKCREIVVGHWRNGRPQKTWNEGEYTMQMN